MATTNSTKKELNKFKLLESDGIRTLYGEAVAVVTGNQKDNDGKIKGTKFVSGKVKNMTYTLEGATAENKIEETGVLLNYYDGIRYVDGDTIYTIYGHPDKWVYDSKQNYGNCGVVSALNILSMAGKVDVVAPSPDFKTANKYITVQETYVDEFGYEKTRDKKIKVKYNETEDKLTLYALQKGYADGSHDPEYYKAISNIEEHDGGTKFTNTYKEEHLYHRFLNGLTSLLSDYGVSSKAVDFNIYLQPGDTTDTWEIDKIKPIEEPEIKDEKGDIIPADDVLPPNGYYSKYAYTQSGALLHEPSGNFAITSEYGTDTLWFRDLTESEFLDKKYTFIKSGTSLYIYYNETNNIELVNYYPESAETKKSSVGLIRFSDGNIVTLESLMAKATLYSSAALEVPVLKYGSFINELAQYVKDGKGVILGGTATEGFAKRTEDMNAGGHAISLVGVRYKEYGDKINEVEGFYVVDSGGWLDASADGAQFVTCEQLYNFLTDSLYMTESDYYDEYIYKSRMLTTKIIVTDDPIRAWADDLNLTGNARNNTLFGNDGNNVLTGGGSTDNLLGGKGNDTLVGGSGNDWLYGGQGNNTLKGGSGNDRYVFQTYARTAKYLTDENGEYVIENGDKVFIGYEKLETHDIVIPGSGQDYLRFENVPDKDELQYFNNNGSLEIRYDFYPIELEEGGSIDDPTTWKVTGYSTVLVKDYFKKGLYSNIASLDDAYTLDLTDVDHKDHAYKFLNIMNKATVGYELDKTTKNKVTGSKFNDSIVSGIHDDVIKAGDGSDIITPDAGDDTIKFGKGNDTANLTYGNNTVYLDSGKNIVSYDEDGYISGYDKIYSGKSQDIVELVSVEKADIKYYQDKNNLVFFYDEHGSSITFMDYYKTGTSVQGIFLANNGYIDLTKFKINTQGIALAGAEFLGTTITSGAGGYGNDTLAAINGISTTFTFNTLYDGVDTVKAPKSGDITLDFTNIGELSRNGNIGFVDGFERHNEGAKNYAYSKQGNNLIINYGLEIDQESMSRIIIQNYFKRNPQKLSYYMKTADSTNSFNLSEATIYFEGLKSSKNKITGSNQNDIIYGGNLADTIKAGAGDDEIYGKKGNDNITGGAGKNTIYYAYGDGTDTISLTKNENLRIVLKNNDLGDFDPNKLSYAFSGNNLLIKNGSTTLLKIKNFKSKDTTGANGSIQLFVENALVMDLKDNIFVSKYTNFTKKKSSYSGKYYSEIIDASGLSTAVNKKGKGVSINAKGGDDIVIGSDFNDTLKGGAGDDLIIAGNGKNTVDGGNGDDRYYLFYDDELDNNCDMKPLGRSTSSENTTIKDTGIKVYDANGNQAAGADSDSAFIFEDNAKLNIWFNVGQDGSIKYDTDKKGRPLYTLTCHIGSHQSTADNIRRNTEVNTATLTGVENIIDKNKVQYVFENTLATNNYLTAIGTWLRGHGYVDVNDAMKRATLPEQTELLQLFDNGWAGQYNGNYYDDFTVDNYIYNGKWYAEFIDASGLNRPTDGVSRGVTVNGNGGEDTIVGSQYDDSFMGGSGDDTFVFTDGENGDDIIYDGEEGDIIKFENDTPNLSYENKDGKLVITHGNNENTITINNFDFSKVENIDTIQVEGQPQTSILLGSMYSDDKIKVALKEGNNFNATLYGEEFSGFGSITNLSNQFDRIKTTGDDVTYSRINNGALIITAKDGGDVTDKITIEDFDFKYDTVRVNDTTTDGKTLDVMVTSDGSYTSTRFKENINVEDNAYLYNLNKDDKIYVNKNVAPTFHRVGNNLLIKYTEGITERTITVRDFDFAKNPANNFDKVYTLSQNDPYQIGDEPIYCDLAGEDFDNGTGDKKDKYREVFTGYGKIKNFDKTLDKIRFDIEPEFSREANSYDLVATYTETIGSVEHERKFTIENFFGSDGDINYEQLSGNVYDQKTTEDMDLHVNLNGSYLPVGDKEGTEYSATKYKEIFKGSGNVKGLSAFDSEFEDRIEIQGTAEKPLTYTRQGIALEITGGDSTITVTDFFDTNKPADYDINVNGDSTANMELNVILERKDMEVQTAYTATRYNEVISGEGSVAGLDNGDAVNVEDSPIYTRVDNGGLIINGKITVDDFFTGGSDLNVQVNNGARTHVGIDSSTEIDVTLTQTDVAYEATACTENITGSGKVRGLSGDDTLVFANETNLYKYTVTNNTASLAISDGSGTLAAEGTDFNTLVNYLKTHVTESNGQDANFSTKTLTVEGISAFDASAAAFAFNNVDIKGNDAGCTFVGSANNDTITGGKGTDVLYGGAGDDIIKGGDGGDKLMGGEGKNVLEGENGNDIYYLFYKNSIVDGEANRTTNEETTINDTDGVCDILYINENINNLNVYYNAKANGVMSDVTPTIYIKQKTGNDSAIVTGVEEIHSGTKYFNYDTQGLRDAIEGWFGTHTGYAGKDVAYVMEQGTAAEKESLYQVFANNGWGDSHESPYNPNP